MCFTRKLLVAFTAAVVVALFGASQATAALHPGSSSHVIGQTDPTGEAFPPCGPAHDGAYYFDSATGRWFRCVLVLDPYIGWTWQWRQTTAPKCYGPDRRRWN
jgi:hypothetical protein